MFVPLPNLKELFIKIRDGVSVLCSYVLELNAGSDGKPFVDILILHSLVNTRRTADSKHIQLATHSLAC